MRCASLGKGPPKGSLVEDEDEVGRELVCELGGETALGSKEGSGFWEGG